MIIVITIQYNVTIFLFPLLIKLPLFGEHYGATFIVEIRGNNVYEKRKKKI